MEMQGHTIMVTTALYLFKDNHIGFFPDLLIFEDV